jgi:EmrB/QacA subfamily drug resistance transporter
MNSQHRRSLQIAHPGLLLVLAVAEFMLTLDLSIVNVALPSIRGALGFSQGSLQWVINAYALTFAGFLLCGGRATDLFGGHRVFLSALGGFTLASFAAGLAPSGAVLLAARAAQGLSAGVLSPATLSILTATYRQGRERSRALSAWTAVAIGGGAAGALIGGLLVSGLSWRWIFFVNVPVGVSLMLAAAGRLPGRPLRAQRGRLDLAGAVTVTAALTALVWALIRSGAAGWESVQVLGGLAAAAALLATFMLIETRLAGNPLVPFAVFRSRALLAGNLTSFLSFVPVMATWFFLTLYLQSLRHASPLEASLLLLPVSMAVIAGSQASFKLVSALDARALFAAGGVIAAVGLGWLGRFSADTALVWVIIPASIAMLGGGLMFAPIMIAATSGVGSERGGLASGLLNTTRQLGGALGLAVLGTVAAAHATGPASAVLPDTVSSGFAAALTGGAIVFLATAILGAIILPAGLGPLNSEQQPRTHDRSTHRHGHGPHAPHAPQITVSPRSIRC